MNKRKIINDPVYGFIHIHSDLIYDLIEHPYFQRLRRIRQLGLTNFVYPAANHTRFQHALGTMYLMDSAIKTLRTKGHEISLEEEEAAMIAILLHDIGHGPFSHSLENTIIENLSHEKMSFLLMNDLNKQFDNKLKLAIEIFNNEYPKSYLHELVSSQLDMDRMDYLKRDSFFTGVSEGVIGSERIISMLNISNGKLVVEEKGIYSIEKFILARRLMYWQVYLHKTVIATENLLIKILLRAKEITEKGAKLFASPSLEFFLNNMINEDYLNNANKEELEQVIENFTSLDDNDILTSIKVWSKNSDTILSDLCNSFVNRHLPKTELQDIPFSNERLEELRSRWAKIKGISIKESNYYIFNGTVSNNTYSKNDEKIEILSKSGKVVDITEVSDILDINIMSKVVRKHFLCYPKQLK